MIGVVRYWKPIVLALVIAVVCTAWRIDRLQQYAENHRGRTNLPATAEPHLMEKPLPTAGHYSET